MTEEIGESEGKWAARRGAAVALRIVIFLIPVVLSVLGTAVISRALPTPETTAILVLYWVLLSIVATSILYMTDKAARQLLPLHALLNLSLIFPDRAPSRFRAAMRASTVRQLERKVEDVKANGLGDSETEAAATLIELVGALSNHDRLTRGHAERVRAYSRMIGEEMGFDDDDISKLTWAGLLHDVGKLFVPAEILNKPGELTDEEFEIIKTHPAAGAALVAPLEGWLGDWLRAVGEHHERWDGDGYPTGLAGEEIALGARIVAVADAFDVLTSARSYKSPSSAAKARAEIQRCAGTQFDTTVVRAFLNISVGRFRLVMGPLSWLAQAPVVGVPVVPAVGAMAGGFATAVGLLVGGLFVPPEVEGPTTEVIAAPAFPGPSPTFPPTTTSTPPTSSTSTSTTSTSITSTTARSGTTSTTVTESFADTFESTQPSANGPIIELAEDLLSGVEDGPATIAPLANDSSGLTLASVSQPSTGSVTVLSNGVVRFNPPANWSGTTSFTYKAAHTNGEIYSGTVEVKYDAAPDAPNTNADTLFRAEDSAPITVDVTANDFDPDFEPIRVISIGRVPSSSPAVGTVSITSAGNVRFAPVQNASGVDSFIYYVADPGGLTESNLLTVTVAPVNDAPFARNDVGSMNEDTVKTFAVRSNDFDIDGGPLTTKNVSSSDGTATTNGNTVTYRPAANSSGTHRVRYAIDDGRGGTASATLTINVAPVNDPPIARNDVSSMNEDTVKSFAVLGNDTDIDGGSLSVASVSSTSGAATTNGSTVTYTPAPNSNGVHRVDYVVSDSRGGTDTGRLTVNVQAVNDAPAFTAGADDTVAEDSGLRIVSGWATGISSGPANESGQTVTFSVTAADPTLFSGQPFINSTTGTLTYTPAPNANGISDITITLTDSGGASSPPQTAQIVVTHVNDPPTFTAGNDDTVAEDAGAQSLTGWATAISAGPPNESSQTVTFNVTADTPSLFSVQPAVDPAGTLTYTPAPDANGTATLTVTLDDSQGGTSAPQTADITITSVNDTPSFTGGSDDSTTEDAGPQSVGGWATAISAGAANESAQSLTFSVVAADPTLFSTQPDVDPTTGTLTYTPAPDANGISVITVTLSDSGGATSPPQTASIIVNHVNDAPSFTAGADQTVDEDAGAQSLTAWATAISAGPPNESSQTVSFVVTADTPSLFSIQPAIDATNGTLTFTPAPDANGTATLTVTLTDSQGGTSAPQTADITVTPVNDPPSFSAGADESIAEDAGPQTVAGWATGISAGPANEASQTLTFDVAADDQTLFSVQPTISPTGTLTYTPAADANGTTTINVTITDSQSGTSAPQTADITLTPVNDDPSFTAGPDDTGAEDSGPQIVTGWATSISAGPADESAQTVTFDVTADDPSLFSVQPAINEATGDLTYTPAADANGTTTINVTLTDSAGATSAPQTADITLTPVNDDPSFTAGADEMIAEDSGPQTVASWATNVSAGPPDEASQTLTFGVTADDASLFSTQPAIDETTGDLTYTPGANQNGTATLTITLTDSAGATSAPQTADITISSANDAPALDPIGDKSGDELTSNGFTATASDSDLPPDTLTYSLGGEPAGAAIDPASGVFSWTPTEAQGPGGFTFDVTVTDDGTPTGSDTETITITVAEVNTDPTIGGAAAASVSPSGSVDITSAELAVSDPDIPAQTLTFTLSTAPVNGDIELAGTPLAQGATFTPADVAGGDLSYQHDGSASAFDVFDVTVADGAGGSDGPDTFAIAITGASPSAITISEIRTDSLVGGDYVELYNGSGAPIDLSVGWELDIEDRNGAPIETVTLSGNIPVNGYALITEATYFGFGTPDVQSTLGAFDRGFGFRVRQGPTTIDAVGTSSGSNFAEGTPLPRMGGILPQAYHRFNGTGLGACVDTDDNAADFVHLWGLGSFSPTGIADGGAVPCGPAPPPDPAPPAADHVVIREYRTDGPGGGSDEFVELFNPGPDQLMNGWTLELNKPPFVLVYAFPDGFVLESGRHFLLAGSGYTGASTPDATVVNSITNDTGVVLWSQSAGRADVVAVELGSEWYEPAIGPGLPRIDGQTYHSYERKNNGCTDTDNNMADFEHHLGFETPTNNSAGPFPCV